MSDENVVAQKPGTWNDQRIEIIIGTLLRTGVILAAAVVLFGGVVYLVRHGQEVPQLRDVLRRAADPEEPERHSFTA